MLALATLWLMLSVAALSALMMAAGVLRAFTPPRRRAADSRTSRCEKRLEATTV